MTTPTEYEELRATIAKRHGELSDRLRRIAEFAVQNPNEMALDTVASLAQRIGVQPSSIIRFANSFGFDGFSQMQLVFRSRLVADAAPSYRERIASMPRDRRANGAKPSAESAVLEKFVADDIAALEGLRGQVPARLLENAADLLAKAETVFLVGQGRSFPVAYYLQYGLSRLDLRAYLVDGIGGTLARHARMARKRDAIVAISFKDYSQDVVAAVAEAAARKVPLIAITDSPLSPIARYATICFEIAEPSDRPFRSLVAPICLAESLVVALGRRVTGK